MFRLSANLCTFAPEGTAASCSSKKIKHTVVPLDLSQKLGPRGASPFCGRLGRHDDVRGEQVLDTHAVWIEEAAHTKRAPAAASALQTAAWHFCFSLGSVHNKCRPSRLGKLLAISAGRRQNATAKLQFRTKEKPRTWLHGRGLAALTLAWGASASSAPSVSLQGL